MESSKSNTTEISRLYHSSIIPHAINTVVKYRLLLDSLSLPNVYLALVRHSLIKSSLSS